METNVNSHLDSEVAIARLAEMRRLILQEVGKVVVAQTEVLDEILIALLSGGHVLLEGVPGLAKTLMVSTLAQTLSLRFSRIQFTPDLMPADITGIEILEEDRARGSRDYRFLEGPIFANLVLADEINRTPPKTQSALLEGMQEQQVTVGRVRHALPLPFFVLATQNPIEQEGTYPLPEAQQDRFLLKTLVRYPRAADEFEVVRRTTSLASEQAEPVLTAEEIIAAQKLVRQVPVGDHIIRYALALVRQTRVDAHTTSENNSAAPDFIKKYVAWGAGPRAVQSLVLGGKARALLLGRTHVTLEDIQVLAFPVLRHRILLNFFAESEGVTPDNLIARLLANTPENDAALLRDPRFRKFLHDDSTETKK